MYNTFNQGCWLTGRSLRCKNIKVFGAEAKNGMLKYIEGSARTMQDVSTLQQSGFKMTGIPLIPSDIAKEPILKVTKPLSWLQKSLARPQPSFVPMLRIMITYTL